MKRRRVERKIGWLVAFGAVAVTLSAAAAANRGPAPAPTAVRHVVSAGDSLWEVAGTMAAPRFDRRELIWLLQEVNGLTRATLTPGQVLVVPVGVDSVKNARREPDGFAARAVIAANQSVAATASPR